MSLQSTAGFVCSTQITLTSFYENASPSTPLVVRTSQSGKEDEGTLHFLLYQKHLFCSVADLGGVRGVQSVYFCEHNCTSPSNDYAAVALMQQQQPGTVTHSRISSLLISRRLTRPRVASRYSVRNFGLPAILNSSLASYQSVAMYVG